MKRKLIKILILASVSLTASYEASAQRWSIGTDVATWLNFGTINGEVSVAVAKELTINASAQYNPWTFRIQGDQMQNRQQAYNLGLRWWPWHIYSGWWFGAGAQYQEYNRGGILSPVTEEGNAFGMSISGGYTLMINKAFNMEFGLGVWTGESRYTTYACPRCGKITDRGRKFFVLPNDIRIAFVFIF